MKKLLASMVAVAAISFLSGCSGEVSTVRDGSMPGYKKTTVGKGFEANFDDGKWTSEERGGKTYVKFTGKVSKALHDKAAKENLDKSPRLGSEFSEALQAKQDAFQEYYNKAIEEARNSKEIVDLGNEIKALYDGSTSLVADSPQLARIGKEAGEAQKAIEAAKEALVPLKRDLAKEEERLRPGRMGAAASAKTPEQANSIFRAMLTNEAPSVPDNVERTEKEKELIGKIKEIEGSIAKNKEAIDQLVKEAKAEAARLDDERTKMYAKAKQMEADRDERLSKVIRDLDKKWEAEQAEFYKQGIEKYLFPVGSEVAFEWLVYPDGGKFELTAASNVTFGNPPEPMKVSYLFDLIFDR